MRVVGTCNGVMITKLVFKLVFRVKKYMLLKENEYNYYKESHVPCIYNVFCLCRFTCESPLHYELYFFPLTNI